MSTASKGQSENTRVELDQRVDERSKSRESKTRNDGRPPIIRSVRDLQDRGLDRVIIDVGYHEQTAQALLLTAGFPRDRIPRFQNAESFWQEAFYAIENGVVEDFSVLLAEVARLFPGNRAFLPWNPDRPGAGSRDDAPGSDVSQDQSSLESEGVGIVIRYYDGHVADLYDHAVEIARTRAISLPIEIALANEAQITLFLPNADPEDASRLAAELQGVQEGIEVLALRPGLRDYFFQRLYGEGPAGRRFEYENVPASTRVSEIGAATAGAYGDEGWGRDQDNLPRPAVVDHIRDEDGERQVQRLNSDHDLDEAGVGEGDTLQTTPEGTAAGGPDSWGPARWIRGLFHRNWVDKRASSSVGVTIRNFGSDATAFLDWVHDQGEEEGVAFSIELAIANETQVSLLLVGANLKQAADFLGLLKQRNDALEVRVLGQGFRDYLFEHIDVEGPGGRRFELSNLPASTPVSEIVNAVIAELEDEWPRDEEGAPITPTVEARRHRDLDSWPVPLDHDLATSGIPDGGSLIVRLDSGLGIPDGDSLQTSPERTAGCFPAGMTVTMADGRERPIEQIREDESVRSGFPSTLTSSAITQRSERTTDHLYVVNGTLRLTGSHPLWTQRGWVAAKELIVGDTLSHISGDPAPVTSVECVDWQGTVYALFVEEPLDALFGSLYVSGFLVGGAALKMPSNWPLERDNNSAPWIGSGKLPSRELEEQLERLLDMQSDRELQVLVQIGSPDEPDGAEQSLAETFINQRRVSTSPRQLLPAARHGERKLPMLVHQGRQLVQQSNRRLAPLFSHPAVARAATEGRAVRLGVADAMALSLSRDEVATLTREAELIEGIYGNEPLMTIPRLAPLGGVVDDPSDFVSCTWGLQQINAPAVWGIYRAAGAGVCIGMLDSGVDGSQPDLLGKVAHWAEIGELGAADRSRAPYDDGEGHGTHCAGVLVGGQHTGRAIGVAPEAKLAVAKVLGGAYENSMIRVIGGLNWLWENDAVDVISLSLGELSLEGVPTRPMSKAIYRLITSGRPVVAAVGNDGQNYARHPANELRVLSVGAVDLHNRVAGFSSGASLLLKEHLVPYDPPQGQLPFPYRKPDLVAPGVGVYSCLPDQKWRAWDGTSMAAPHVAGAIALLLSATRLRERLRGLELALEINDIITGSVEEIGEQGQDLRYGWGRLDVLRAIDLATKNSW